MKLSEFNADLVGFEGFSLIFWEVFTPKSPQKPPKRALFW